MPWEFEYSGLGFKALRRRGWGLMHSKISHLGDAQGCEMSSICRMVEASLNAFWGLLPLLQPKGGGFWSELQTDLYGEAHAVSW